MTDEREPGTDQGRFALLLAKVITVVWLLSIAAGFVSPSYSAPPELSALIMAVAGFAFGADLIRSRQQ